MKDQDDGSKIMKAVLIGDGAVGKTSIRRNYLGEDFTEGLIATIGVDLATKRVLFDQDIVKFIIWDLAGQPTFEKVRGHAIHIQQVSHGLESVGTILADTENSQGQ